MNKIKRKIIVGTVIFCCAAVGISAASHISKKAESVSVPASLIDYESESPIIVLDAGHGECS